MSEWNSDYIWNCIQLWELFCFGVIGVLTKRSFLNANIVASNDLAHQC